MGGRMDGLANKLTNGQEQIYSCKKVKGRQKMELKIWILKRIQKIMGKRKDINLKNLCTLIMIIITKILYMHFT